MANETSFYYTFPFPFKTGPHMAHYMRTSLYTRASLLHSMNFPASCLHLPSAGITDMHQWSVCASSICNSNSGLQTCYTTNSLPPKRHLNPRAYSLYMLKICNAPRIRDLFRMRDEASYPRVTCWACLLIVEETGYLLFHCK